MKETTHSRRAIVRALAAAPAVVAIPAAAAVVPTETAGASPLLEKIVEIEERHRSAKAAFAAAAEALDPPKLPAALNYLVVGRQHCSWREESRLIDGEFVCRSDKLIAGRRAPRFVRTVESIADDIAHLRPGPETKAKRKALRKLMAVAERHRRDVEAAERRHGLPDLHAAIGSAEHDLVAVCEAAFAAPASSTRDLVAMAAAIRAHARALLSYYHASERTHYGQVLAEATLAVLGPGAKADA